MSKLEITFGRFLLNYDVDDLLRRNGVVFHRWLPNGEDDAIKIDFDQYNAKASIWCERRGYVDDSGFIKYEHERKEVDDKIIGRQALLEGGALFGKVVLTGLTDEQIKSVTQNKIGSPEYIEVGKKVVKKIIDPLIEYFSLILRDTYGQYWIEPPNRFNSKVCSLGQYCSRLSMEWFDGKGNLQEFIPNEKEICPIFSVSTMVPYDDYISKEDWGEIGNLLQSDYKPPLAATLISNSNRLYEEGRESYALIEAVTALELAIEYRVGHITLSSSKMQDQIQGFWQMPLPARLTLVALFSGISEDEIELVLSAIKERNRIVHDGTAKKQDLGKEIKSVFRVVRELLGKPSIRYPAANTGNMLRPSPEDWDK